ncbi:MAG: glycerophosphodiester phosphodiesterase, partial [Firmicutes bacterium]|nr:glycerophosphodiester phosphodiesterase [Bacillota bacterium]
PTFASERIPTLDELAAWAKGKVRLNIEIKSTPQTIGDLPEQVVAICRNHGIVEETEVISFDHVAIMRVKAMEPNLAGAINFGARLVDPVGAARAAAADVLNMHWAFITPDLIELAHGNGLGVQCFMNDPELAKTLAGWGVDFMDADFPDRVKAAVRAR